MSELTALPPAEDTSLHQLTRAERSETMSPAFLRAAFGVAEDEKLPDLSMVRVSDMVNFTRYSTPPGMFVDLAPVHVLSQTSLATIGAEMGSDLDVRRFRPNVLLALDDPDDGLPESQWTGARLKLGEVVLDVLMPTIRCVVPSRAQPGFEVDRRITKAVAFERSGAWRLLRCRFGRHGPDWRCRRSSNPRGGPETSPTPPGGTKR